MTSRRRERVTVEKADLVIQPVPDEVDAFAPARFGESVTELEQTRQDRAIGRRRFEVVVDGWRFEVTTEHADRAGLRDRAARAGAEAGASVDTTLRAQIPGRITRIWAADGEAVEQGQRLLAVEAMKMENEIRAPHAGMVRNIRVEPGARVERNDELLTVAR
jgi:biotin carboxyl carrier protein